MNNRGKTRQELELEIAKALAKLREEKGLSQEALAIQLGKGQSDIAKIEKGNRRITVIEMLEWLVALQIPFKDFEEILISIYDEIGGSNSIWKKPNEE